MKLKSLVSYLSEKNKLSLRNVRSGREIWHVFISRINLVLAAFALLVILFALTVAAVVYTPLLQFLPGQTGNPSKELLARNAVRLDSLSNELAKWEFYYTNISRIVDGQLPLTTVDSTRRLGVRGTVTPRVEMDSVLRHQMTDAGSPYELNEGYEARRRAESSFDMLPPVKGAIATPFSPQAGLYGVALSATANQSVLAVLDGTVMFSGWVPDTGNTLIIQHAGNLVSAYKQVGTLVKVTGEPVRAGEAIGITEQLQENRSTNMIFELWYNGTPVDPENYITF